MFMKKPWDFFGDKMMKTAGDKAKRGIDNFMEAFQDYEIETIVANIEAGDKIPEIKIALQIKMKKRKEDDK
jgi:hypothetical protein